MLKIRIDRAWKKPTYTISRVYVNGEYFGCNALEDTDRGLTRSTPLAEIKAKKVYGQTAIPSGTYTVDYTYSPHFKRMMPAVLNVAGFEGIRIHAGNTNKDTLGCILIGRNTVKGGLTESKVWTDKLTELIKNARAKHEVVSLTID